MRRGVAPLAIMVAIGAVAALLYHLVNTDDGSDRPASVGTCTARAAGHTVVLSASQAENAALIAAIGERRGMPARAVSIALTAAYQESKLENVHYGDRDSLGLFQQRPSAGWGTPQQIMNRTHATNAFFDALERVPGYATMDITNAAQEVQRSAYPTAYRQHEADGRVLASALTGNSQAAFSCAVDARHLGSQPEQANGLTARANTVRAVMQHAFGDLSLGGFAPGGVQSGHMPGSAHYEGRAIDVFFRPINAHNTIRGWALAQYLVANASRLQIEHVIFDGEVWTAGERSIRGWHPYSPPEATGNEDAATLAVLEHRDHVHVDVW